MEDLALLAEATIRLNDGKEARVEKIIGSSEANNYLTQNALVALHRTNSNKERIFYFQGREFLLKDVLYTITGQVLSLGLLSPYKQPKISGKPREIPIALDL